MIVLNRIHMPGTVWMHTVCSHGLEVDVHGQVGQVSRLGLGSLNTTFSLVLIDILRRGIVGKRGGAVSVVVNVNC
jgi:hypothetical protein